MDKVNDTVKLILYADGPRDIVSSAFAGRQ